MFLLLKIVLMLFVYSVACLGIGNISLHVLTRFIKQSHQASPGTEIATAFILGQGVLASFWILLALEGWFIPELLFGVVLTVAISGVFFLYQRWTDFRRQIVSIWRELCSEPLVWQLMAGLTLFLCLLWVTSVGRSLAWDAITFYMSRSKLVAYSHQLLPLRGFENLSSFGFLGEIHYAALTALADETAATLFSWPTSIAAAIILMAVGRQVGIGRRGQWIILTIFYSTSAITFLSGDGKVDLFALALGISAYYWGMKIQKGPRQLASWMTGLLVGFSSIAKISYVPVMGTSILLIAGWGLLDEKFSQHQFLDTLKSILLCGFQTSLALILALLPHFIMNGLLFDNPFLPFGSDYHTWENQSWFSPVTTNRILLTYPLSLTYGSFFAQMGNLSPLVLAFLPLSLYLPRPRSWFRSPLFVVTFSAVVGILTWVIFRPSVFAPRYILATLMLLTLLPAKAVEYASRSVYSRWIIAGIFISVLVTGLSVGRLSYTMGAFSPVKTYQYFAGKLNVCGRDDLHYCEPMELINQEAEFGDRILLGSYPRYWLRSDLLQCLSNIEDEAAIFSAPEDDRWLAIYQRGFRYILVATTTHAHFLSMLDYEDLPSWLNVVEISNDGQIILYRLDTTEPPGDQLLACQRRSSSKVWDIVSP